ncbi:PGA biosynthesis protein CapA [Streptomyces sp. Ru73]|uniref:CapA family protein n=1 Tax=Streptomyces sp. Ru73 TaxID=2080748 RepID=UPI000CDD560E|nr:PGA biosynthesis protein CapA [Streptomyces sp. Ru73]
MAATAALLALTGLTGCAGAETEAAVKPDGRRFTLAAAGDILIHPELTEQARKDAAATGGGAQGLDFDRIMAGVKPVISKADLAVCHFETVAGEPRGPFRGFPDFVVPPQIATTLKKTGYDTCSTASNHTLDHGASGVQRTLDVLDAAGLKHTGSARSAREAATPLITDVKGLKVAQLSYTFGFNGTGVPADKPWLANTTDLGKIKAAEHAARKAGADAVVLSIHWGSEHHPEPSADQLGLGRRIARETGIDLVIGHHAHVVQPMEKVDGTWIAYGLGNQLARHEKPSGLTEEGVIGWFEFAERQDGGWDVSPKYVPTLVDLPPDPDESGRLPAGAVTAHRLVDVAAALRDPDGLSEDRAARYRLAFERTRGTLLNRGAAADGLRPLEPLPAG